MKTVSLLTVPHRRGTVSFHVVKNINPEVKSVQVQLIMRHSCGICARVHEELAQLREKHDKICLQVYNVENGDTLPTGKQPFITPAVWVNGSLWYLGGFDSRRFEEKLSRLECELQRSPTFHSS